MFVYGLPLDHAWLLDQDGNVIDPTLRGNDDDRVIGYYGVALKTDYVWRAVKLNDRYGASTTSTLARRCQSCSSWAWRPVSNGCSTSPSPS